MRCIVVSDTTPLWIWRCWFSVSANWSKIGFQLFGQWTQKPEKIVVLGVTYLVRLAEAFNDKYLYCINSDGLRFARSDQLRLGHSLAFSGAACVFVHHGGCRIRSEIPLVWWPFLVFFACFDLVIAVSGEINANFLVRWHVKCQLLNLHTRLLFRP